jgi:hypothetical protein
MISIAYVNDQYFLDVSCGQIVSKRAKGLHVCFLQNGATFPPDVKKDRERQASALPCRLAISASAPPNQSSLDF